MVDDTVALLELLHECRGGPVMVAGFSLGAAIALMAVARRPDLVSSLVAVATDIDGVAAATHAYDFALDVARVRGHRRAIAQLEAIGPPPHLEIEQFTTRARWVLDFGGITTGATYRTVVRDLALSLAGSSAYTTGEVVRVLRQIAHTQAALLSDLATLDLFEAVPALDVPVVMAQGQVDQVSPARTATRYAETLRATDKQLVWFEHSAHTPQLEEPEKFRELLKWVRATEAAPR
jgi:pimeloyl-ACP methyl ester carboxylesterase